MTSQDPLGLPCPVAALTPVHARECESGSASCLDTKYSRTARRRDRHVCFSGSSTDPEEILRRLKVLRESGRSQAVSNAQGDSTPPWLYTGVRASSDRPGEHRRGSHVTLPMGLWRNSLFPTPPAHASSDLSVLACKADERQDRQEPLTGVYWLKAVEQLRPQSPRMALMLSPRLSPRVQALQVQHFPAATYGHVRFVCWCNVVVQHLGAIHCEGLGCRL